MAAILGILIFYLILQALLLAMAVGVGLVLHWCIPSLDIGMGVLVGVLSTIASAYLLVQLMRARHVGMLEELLAEQDDEDEELPELSVTVPPRSRSQRRRRQ